MHVLIYCDLFNSFHIEGGWHGTEVAIVVPVLQSRVRTSSQLKPTLQDVLSAML